MMGKQKVTPKGLGQKAGYRVSPNKEKKNAFGFGAAENAFQRLGVCPFDPQANFASTLMFGFFYNFSKKYFFGRSKDGDMTFSAKSQISRNFFKVSIVIQWKP